MELYNTLVLLKQKLYGAQMTVRTEVFRHKGRCPLMQEDMISPSHKMSNEKCSLKFFRLCDVLSNVGSVVHKL